MGQKIFGMPFGEAILMARERWRKIESFGPFSFVACLRIENPLDHLGGGLVKRRGGFDHACDALCSTAAESVFPLHFKKVHPVVFDRACDALFSTVA